MVNWSSGLEYIKIFKELKGQIPQVQKSQEQPDHPESKNTAVNFLWTLRTLCAKLQESGKIQIPQNQFLDKLMSLPDNKEEFEKEVKANMLEVKNSKLCIKANDQSEPVGDFSNQTLNEIENWALTLLGTFGKK